VRGPKQSFPFLDGFERVVVSGAESEAADLAWTGVRLPGLLRELGVDVYHGMKMPGPFFNSVPTVHTVHGVLEDRRCRFPSSAKARAFVKLYGKPVLRKIGRLIAVSQFVSDHLVRVLEIDNDRIDVIPHGVDSRFAPRPAPLVQKTLARFGLNRFLLCVGNVTPVKNQITAVRVFARLAARHPRLELAIAGTRTDAYADLVRNEARRLDVLHRVKFLGFVPADDLVMLLNGAELLLFPSLTEGCPVSMLEALACGLPVVASRVAGLAEIGEDAAAFVTDPYDDAEFAVQAERFLSNPALRAAASARCLAAATRFSWERSARAHLASYAACAATASPDLPTAVAS
jgi:glycosyltransferase involved in cell wall biosynthesis